MAKKYQEIWGVPVGAPELAELTSDQLEEVQIKMAKLATEEGRRQLQREREILGLPPRRNDVVS